MNPEIKLRFLEALKSDKYPHGRFMMRQFNGLWHWWYRFKSDTHLPSQWCAIGILADLAVQDGEAMWWLNEYHDYWRLVHLPLEGAWDPMGSSPPPGSLAMALPFQVQQWAGMSHNEERMLIDISDSHGRDAVIKYVEENF